jgi:hypothetical protein
VLAAHGARLRGGKRRAPAGRVGGDAVGHDTRLHPLAREHRPDQLVEAGGDDQRIVSGHEFGEPRAHANVLEQPADDLVQRRSGLHLVRSPRAASAAA